MQRECGWCGQVLTPGTLPATTGICPGCLAEQLAKNKQQLTDAIGPAYEIEPIEYDLGGEG